MNERNKLNEMKPENTMQQDVAEYVTILSNSPSGEIYALRQLWDKYGRDTVTPEIEVQTNEFDANERAKRWAKEDCKESHKLVAHPYSKAVLQCSRCGMLKDIDSTI